MSTPKSSMELLAIHTITTKPWSFAESVDRYSAANVAGISIWLDAIEGMKSQDVRTAVKNAGLQVPALVRGGFFCASNVSDRMDRIDHNRRLIELAHDVSAEMLVLVVGAVPGEPLQTQREWVRDGIEALLKDAEKANVKLAIEPLHPMYAADKSCINRLSEARAICEQLQHKQVGVAIDVYHVWWDPELEREIQMLGQTNSLFAFHLCDWRVPTRDLLNDRALMGDGCIDIAGIRRMMEHAGFVGWNEVEIFSSEHWAKDQHEFLDEIIVRYKTCCGSEA